MKVPPAVRFDRHVAKQPDGGCWLWTAHKNRKGYGDFGVSAGDVVLAHRFSFEQAFGPIPVGACVLHQCDVPACVRPDHLFLGSKADNNADMRAKKRHATGERVGTSRITSVIADEIRRSSGSHRAIGDRFGVHQTTVTRIKNGAIWPAEVSCGL